MDKNLYNVLVWTACSVVCIGACRFMYYQGKSDAFEEAENMLRKVFVDIPKKED